MTSALVLTILSPLLSFWLVTMRGGGVVNNSTYAGIGSGSKTLSGIETSGTLTIPAIEHTFPDGKELRISESSMPVSYGSSGSPPSLSTDGGDFGISSMGSAFFDTYGNWIPEATHVYTATGHSTASGWYLEFLWLFNYRLIRL
jgi:hypothetical protein